MLTAQQLIPYCDVVRETDTHKELITCICWFDLKNNGTQFSRAHLVNDVEFFLAWLVEYHPYYQITHLPTLLSFQHTPLLMASN